VLPEGGTELQAPGPVRTIEPARISEKKPRTRFVRRQSGLFNTSRDRHAGNGSPTAVSDGHWDQTEPASFRAGAGSSVSTDRGRGVAVQRAVKRRRPVGK
jgi:hypothetical protein